MTRETLDMTLQNKGTSILWWSNSVETPGPKISSRPSSSSTAIYVAIFQGLSSSHLLHRVTILLGVGGVIYTPHTLEPLKELGLESRLLTLMQPPSLL
eukprot:1151570-Pelagomonas_calceolata.AAC.1